MLATEQMTREAAAYFAGVLTGRGGFGPTKSGEVWIYFTTLDSAIAEEALELWGGFVTQRHGESGHTTYKYLPRREDARDVLEDLTPYLRGRKRERAEELLRQYEVGAAR